MPPLLLEPILGLFVILAIGSWLGHLSVKGIALGSAAVFFVALAFGHFGFKAIKEVTDLGLLLFVYAVGLQAGPRFFRTFRREASGFVLTGLAAIGAGAAMTILAAWAFKLPDSLAVGLFAGALTNTPALAAALDAVGSVDPLQKASVSVGYAVSYPFALVSVVLLVQFLPRLLRRDVRGEEAQWVKAQGADLAPLQVKQFLVTNSNCHDKTLGELHTHRLSVANISRIRRGEKVFAAAPDIRLQLNDVVMAVGSEEELDKLCIVLGEETQVDMRVNTDVASADVEITEHSLVGKRLAELRFWEQYNVVVTRIRRQGLELTPTGNSTLELGDTARVVGVQASVTQFAALASREGHRVEETNMVPFLLGLVIGILVGAIPFQLPSGIVVRLGSAGGAFLVSLLLGHLGRIGPFRLYVPAAARNLSRELGLMLFLAGAGATAGASLVSVLQQQGPILIVAGMVVTVAAIAATLLLSLVINRMNVLGTLGALSATMTNPPALAAATAQAASDLPALVYASIYPVALIFKIVTAQVLVALMRGT